METSRVLDKEGRTVGMRVNGVLQKPPYPPGQSFIENVGQTKKTQTMSRQVRMLRIPKMAWKKGDPLEEVKAHLTALHGEAAAIEKIRQMSGFEVLTLAEELKSKAGDPPTTTRNGKTIRVLQSRVPDRNDERRRP